MKPRHQVSKDAIELIKRFEGYRRASAQLPGGGYTIGYGHTLTARAGVEIDERDAEALLRYDLIAVAGAVNDLTFTPLTQNQFDALVSFCFNVGIENFRRSSVLRRVNEGNLLQAAAALEIWRKSEFEGEKIVIDALIRRRAAEKSLFLLPPAGYVPAPSPVLPPRVDYDAVGSGPKEKAVRMVVSLDGETAEAVPEVIEGAPTDVGPVQPDASPITIAAEVVAAKLQTIASDEVGTPPVDEAEEVEAEAPAVLDAEPEAVDAEAPPETEPATVLDPEPADGETVTEPVIEDAIEVIEPQDIELEDQTALEPLVEAPAAPLADFTLTSPPADQRVEEALVQPVEPSAASEPEPESEPLPLVEPTRSQPLAAAAETQPTLYKHEPIAGGDDFPAFETDTVKPVTSTLLPLFALGVIGLVAFAFSIVWGLSTSSPTGGISGLQVISWIVGGVGIACVVVAFYKLVSRLGGSED